MERSHLKMGLRGQLVLLFLVVSLIPLLVVSFMTRTLGVNALKNTIGENLSQLAKEKLDQADRSISTRLEAIQSGLESIDAAVASADRHSDKVSKLLHASAHLEDHIGQLEVSAGPGSQIIITNSHRQVIRVTGRDSIPYFPQIKAEWWYKAYNNGFGYHLIEDVQYDAKRQLHYLPIAMPIRHKTEAKTEVVGVLRAVMTLPELSKLVKQPVGTDRVGRKTESFIINEYGQVIASSSESSYSFLERIEMSTAVMEGVLNASDVYYGHEMEGESDTEGEKKVYGWARTHRWTEKQWKGTQNFINWTVLVLQPEMVAFQEINALTKKVLTFTLISCIVIIPIAWIVSQRIVMPIIQVTQGARAIGRGEFDQAIRVASSNEVGILAEEFNAMRGNLKHAIEKITEEEKKMTAIVNSLTEGLILVDGDNQVLHINPVAELLLNVSVGQIGADFTQIIRDDELTTALKESQRQISLNKADISEVTLDRDDGKLVLRVVASPFLDESGAMLGTVYVFDDITREKEIDQMKSDLISLVNHELRTPLTSIIGFVSFMSDGKAGPVNEKQKNILARVERQSKQLTALINDMLDVSRIEAGHIQMRQELVSVLEIAQQRIEEILPQADAKSIRLQLRAPESLPTIIGDEARLGQVFTNLIGNAIKFTLDNGEVTVKLKVDGHLLHVEIIDTGPGIPDEERHTVFDRFYQLSDFRTRQQGGSGLGLSIVKHIVEAHGGKLWVDDAEGRKGSNFQFVLPLKMSSNPSEHSSLL